MTTPSFGPTPWLTTKEAAAYAKRPTPAAFRMWARRRGIPIVDGRVNRRDIDATLKTRRVA
jgi:hypothetical protein